MQLPKRDGFTICKPHDYTVHHHRHTATVTPPPSHHHRHPVVQPLEVINLITSLESRDKDGHSFNGKSSNGSTSGTANGYKEAPFAVVKTARRLDEMALRRCSLGDVRDRLEDVVEILKIGFHEYMQELEPKIEPKIEPKVEPKVGVEGSGDGGGDGGGGGGGVAEEKHEEHTNGSSRDGDVDVDLDLDLNEGHTEAIRPSELNRRGSADELMPFTCDTLAHCSQFNAILDLPDPGESREGEEAMPPKRVLCNG